MAVPPATGPWTERLRTIQCSFHDLVYPYPGLARALVRRPPTPGGIERGIAVAATLVDCGLAPDDAAKVFTVVTVFTTGHLLTAEATQDRLPDELGATSRRRPTSELAQDRAEHVRRVVAAGQSDREVTDALLAMLRDFDDVAASKQFAWGIDRLLAGLAEELGD